MAFATSWVGQPQQSFQQWSAGGSHALLPAGNDKELAVYANALSNVKGAFPDFQLAGGSNGFAQPASRAFSVGLNGILSPQLPLSPTTATATFATPGTASATPEFQEVVASSANSPTASPTTSQGTGTLGTNGPTEGTPLFNSYAIATGAQDMYIQAQELPGTDSQTLVDATNTYIQSANAYRQALASPSASPFASWASAQQKSFDSNFAPPMITAAGVTAPLGDNGQPMEQIGSENRPNQLFDPAQFDIQLTNKGYVAPPPIPVMQPGESTADYDTAMENVFQKGMSTDQVAYAGWLIGQTAQGRQVNISDSEAQAARADAAPGQQNSATADGAHDAQAWSAMATYLQSAHASDLVQENNENDSDGAFTGPINDSDGILNAGYFGSHPPSFGQGLGESLLGTLNALGTNPIVEAVADATGQQWLTDLPIDPGALPGLSLVQGAAKGIAKAGDAAAAAAGDASRVSTDALSAGDVGENAAANEAALNAADPSLLGPYSGTTAGAPLEQIVVVPNEPVPLKVATNTQALSGADKDAFEADPNQVAQPKSGWPGNPTYADQGAAFASSGPLRQGINQGDLGDCGPAAAFGTLLSTPEGQAYVKSKFENETDTSIECKVGDDWVATSKDLPTDPATGKPLANNSNGNGAFFSYWESSAAKEAQANGQAGYDTLDQGTKFPQWVDQIFGSDAGPTTEYIQNPNVAGDWGVANTQNSVAASDVQNLVNSSGATNTLTMAATGAAPGAGLTKSHWYGVLGTTSAQGGMVKIFDPWGANATIQGVKSTDGTAWIPMSVFLQNFTDVGQVKYSP